MTTPDSAPAVALEPKTKLSGKILKTTLAGALVDIGQSLPGVIHISQLQQEAVNKVEDVVKEGQTVEVWVRRVKKDRIELTMIEPLGFEWKEIVPDMIVKGKVVRLETYGAFVDFGAERPGLIHVSELTRGYVKTASEVVKEGEEIEAKVLDVDRRKRQIRLSMKALQPEVVEEAKPEREERKQKRGQRRQAQEQRQKGRRFPDGSRSIQRAAVHCNANGMAGSPRTLQRTRQGSPQILQISHGRTGKNVQPHT